MKSLLTNNIRKEIAKKLVIYTCVPGYLFLSTDKLHNILVSFEGVVVKRQRWETALGVFISLVGLIVTSEFKNIFGISRDVWFAVSIMAALISGIQLLLLTFFKLTNKMNAKTVIQALVNEEKQTLHRDSKPKCVSKNLKSKIKPPFLSETTVANRFDTLGRRTRG